MKIKAALASAKKGLADAVAERDAIMRDKEAQELSYKSVNAEVKGAQAAPVSDERLSTLAHAQLKLEHLEKNFPGILGKLADAETAVARATVGVATLEARAAVLRDYVPSALKVQAAGIAYAAALADLDAERDRLRREHVAVPAELLHRILDVAPDLTRTIPPRARAAVELAFDAPGAAILQDNPAMRHDADALARFAERLDQDLTAAELARIAELVRPAPARPHPGPARQSGYTTGGREKRFA